MDSQAAPIAIVGGGIAGLSAAWAVAQAGQRDLVVFEARKRLGGIVGSESKDGFVMEAGADSFLANKQEAGELCRELGLESEIVGTLPSQGARILHQGRLEPLPAGWRMAAPTRLGPVLATRLLPASAKLKIALRWKRRSEPHEDESVGAYLRRWFGEDAGNAIAATIAAPLLSGVYGGDVDKLGAAQIVSAAAARPLPGSGPVFHSLRRGMGSLTESLVAQLEGRLPGRVRTGCEVRTVEATAGGYRIVFADPAREATFARAVIVATPAWRAADLLRGLDAELAAGLAEIPYVSSVNINLAYRQAPAIPGGHGFVATQAYRPLLACTFAHQKFPERTPAGAALLRLFYDAAAAQWPDARLERRAVDDLQRMLGVTQKPDWVRVGRALRAMPQYAPGHGARIATLRRRLERWPGLRLAGNAYQGVGVPDCIASGQTAAAELEALP